MDPIKRKRARQLWQFATAVGHYGIAVIAFLSYEHIITPSNHLLAFLIFWANFCTALHHYGDSMS